MTPVALFELLLLLMATVIALEFFAERLRMPPAAALIVGGLVLAVIPGTPDLRLDPDLALVLFLPPLLMASAYFTVWRDFRANLRIILQLAVGAVAFTTLVVGVVAHLVEPELPWAACFALGAIVSPPDAVAAKAVLARMSLPPRLVVLLEGESLVNDATGLVLFRFAVAAGLTGAFRAHEAIAGFFVLAAGGVAFGALCGLAVSHGLSRLRDANFSIVISLLVSWGVYIAGEWLGVSGVLSCVACGMVFGWRQHTALSASVRLRAKAVWEVVTFVLESMIFVLIGLSLRGVMERVGGDWHAARPLLPAAGAIVAAVIVSRFVWILPAAYIPRALFPGLRRRDPYPPLSVPVVLSWAGMRGVVSLAAALSLPEAFPGRDFIVATTFGVIMVTVLVQGATLPPLIRILRVGSFKSVAAETMSEPAARAVVAAAQLAEVERLSVAEDGTHRHPRLFEQYGYRARAAQKFSEADGRLTGARQDHFAVILGAVKAGREELLRLHRTGKIHDSVLHALEQELDLSEITAQRYLDQRA